MEERDIDREVEEMLKRLDALLTKLNQEKEVN